MIRQSGGHLSSADDVARVSVRGIVDETGFRCAGRSPSTRIRPQVRVFQSNPARQQPVASSFRAVATLYTTV
jgi:hypothetical protein